MFPPCASLPFLLALQWPDHRTGSRWASRTSLREPTAGRGLEARPGRESVKTTVTGTGVPGICFRTPLFLVPPPLMGWIPWFGWFSSRAAGFVLGLQNRLRRSTGRDGGAKDFGLRHPGSQRL